MTLSADEGTLYVANADKQIIQSVNLSTYAVTAYAGGAGIAGTTAGTGTAARFNEPFSTVNVSGNLYVADTYNQGIRKIDGSQAVTTFAGTLGTVGATDATGTSALFNYPKGITAVGTDLYVADTSNYLIRKITSGGMVSAVAGTSGQSGYVDGSGAGVKFGAPFGVAANATYLFVSDSANNSIRSVLLAAPNTVATVAGSLSATAGSTDSTGTTARFSTPAGIVSDTANSRLYVADQGNHTIRMIDVSASPATVTTIAGAAGVYGSTDGNTGTNNGATARFNTPTGLALNAAGTILYVSDQYYTKVRKIVLPASPTAPTSFNVTVTTLTATF